MATWYEKIASIAEYQQFSKMISVSIIRYVYSFGSIFLTIGIFVAMIAGQLEFIFFVLLITFGNLFWRLICEAWILFFRIHESLVAIEHNTSGGQNIEVK